MEFATNPVALLGLAGIFACLTLLTNGSRNAPRPFLLMAAASFGIAVGLRGVGSTAAIPMPGAVPFVAFASFGSFAFHRAYSWVEAKLRSEGANT